MRELTTFQCYSVVGGEAPENPYKTYKILTEEGVALFSIIGMCGGGYMGSIASASHPIIGGWVGATAGALFLPIYVHLTVNGLIKAYEVVGLL